MAEEFDAQVHEIVSACLAYRTRKLARTVTRLYNDRLRPLGLNIAEMNLMAAIAMMRSVQPAELGRAMELEKSTLSRNISRLAARGWVASLDHPDGHGALLSLTAEGNEMLVRAVPAWREAQAQARALAAGAGLKI
ncbi:MarR family winged helix-turn-helix transcriptional regulator [Nonomuraea basaltis]|uniref:MarR family winged helix-turn-helix transcriptional regulator n=1 Tax=Nonomuraea basaltis TaxID=2495887 RepID=UPI00110C6D82|nr:MarR family transcriptional regulator [Nonomuraea basaltis]TMR89914.1 MarR family transcriptional regulator [Nonomuraea basaltis]